MFATMGTRGDSHFFIHGWRGWSLYWGAWALLAAAIAISNLVHSSPAVPLGWLANAVLHDGAKLLAGLLAAWYLPLDRDRRWRSLAIHLAMAILVACVFTIVNYLQGQLFDFFPQRSLYDQFRMAPSHLFFYGISVGLGYAFVYYRDYTGRIRQEAELEARLARTRLQMLRGQLQPDFLLETLQAIETMMHRDRSAADRMIAELGDLLRLSLSRVEAQEVALKEELEFLEPYLEIQQIRFGERLRVEWRIEPATLDAQVPHLLLQPLVENAIKHGLAPRAAPGRIEISAAHCSGMLQLQVRDNGGRPGDATSMADDAGLADLHAHLRQAYGSEYLLAYTRDGHQRTATLRIPFREHEIIGSGEAPDGTEARSDPPAGLWESVDDAAASRTARFVDPLSSPAAWLLFFGWWTFCGLAYAQSYHVAAASAAKAVPWSNALVYGFADKYPQAAMCVAALFLARYLPISSDRWRSRIPVHLAAALLLIAAAQYAGMVMLALGSLPTAEMFSAALVLKMPVAMNTYVVLLGVGHAAEYYRQAQQRDMAAMRLRAQLATATVQLLKMQLHPHFLFNALNTVSSLVRTNVRVAAHTLGLLQRLLRMSLSRVEAQEVALKEELEFLEPYLEIQQIRFGERLRVEWRIEPATLDAQVPHLLLQPLVENAIKHGLAPRAAPGRIEISAAHCSGMLQLQVRDNGVGFSVGSSRRCGFGVGLANTRARLEQLYGERYQLAIESLPEEGTRVSVMIPFSGRVPQPARAHSPRDVQLTSC